MTLKGSHLNKGSSLRNAYSNAYKLIFKLKSVLYFNNETFNNKTFQQYVRSRKLF